MKKYKVEYIREVTERYEVEIEANDEQEADEVISRGKYGEEIKGEKLVESYSDSIEVTDLEEIE